jgi:hypothetical protein
MKEVDATEEASSLKRERPAFHNMEFLTFLFFLVLFVLLDPDPVYQN